LRGFFETKRYEQELTGEITLVLSMNQEATALNQ